ncbi:hypothetical protein [Actinoallomurus acanthiterrae]
MAPGVYRGQPGDARGDGGTRADGGHGDGRLGPALLACAAVVAVFAPLTAYGYDRLRR